MSIITLTTDFGASDGYVGTMKGVILSIAPDVALVDITHEIAPQNIRQAAYVLHDAAPYFPRGTIHLAVVDPGVGSARRALAVRTSHGFLVGPDNGLFTLFLADEPDAECRAITNAKYMLPRISSTFHGRDVFAPVAAHLANGADLADLGPRITDPVTFPIPRPDATGRRKLARLRALRRSLWQSHHLRDGGPVATAPQWWTPLGRDCDWATAHLWHPPHICGRCARRTRRTRRQFRASGNRRDERQRRAHAQPRPRFTGHSANRQLGSI